MKKRIKYCFLFLTYIWLRFDPILRLTFRNDWTARYEFMKTIFGEKDTTKFLQHRVKLVKMRNKKPTPFILPKQVADLTKEFLKQTVKSKTGRQKRKQIIRKLIFWATDKDINQQNIESYKTRSTIVDSLCGSIFQNSLAPEVSMILAGLEKIVFSRVTYLGSKGEPSPIVHDVIITNVGRLLTAHFNELNRLKQGKIDQSTKIKLIKEIQKSKQDRGSFAYSAATPRQDDEYKHKFPLAEPHAQLLLKILHRYQFSAWPDSREKAEQLMQKMEQELGISRLTDKYLTDILKPKTK